MDLESLKLVEEQGEAMRSRAFESLDTESLGGAPHDH